MKNIYDIITEQRSLIDINISNYDIDYLTNYIFESQDTLYIEESSSLVQKVIEFIKSIIQKIKELIAKVVNFFTGKKDIANKLEQQIKDANEGKTSESNDNAAKADLDEMRKETEELRKKNEKRKKQYENEQKAAPKIKEFRDKKKEVMNNRNNNRPKAAGLEAVLKQSKQKVKMRYYAKLDKKMDLSNKFFNATQNVANKMMERNNTNEYDMLNYIISDTFKGRGGNNADLTSAQNRVNKLTMEQRINMELGEDFGTEPTDRSVSIEAETIAGYVKQGDVAIKYLRGMERQSNDVLNKALNKVQGSLNTAGSDDKGIGVIQKTCSFIAQFVNAMCKSIVRAKNDCDTIATKVVHDYVAAMRG